ncbi:MAG: acyltransferase family protein, partial [Ilumatobacteraceae bacterium]
MSTRTAARAHTSFSAPKRQLNRVPYLPGLDGMRAFAVVAVMIYHANHTWLGGGFLGVEVFFVISGYLITLLLIGEHERTGRVALSKFWLRRARRLLPAVLTMMSALAVYMALFKRQPQGRTRGDFLAGVFYSSNWYQIFVGQGYTANEAFVPLRHLWSLAVEEQFYLVWPLVMIGILRLGRNRLPRVALWLFGISAWVSFMVGLLFANGDVATVCSPDAMNGYWKLFGRCISINETLYLGTFTRAGGLLLGAAFAMMWRPMAVLRGRVRDKGRQLDVLAVVGLAGLGLLMWKLTLSGDGRQTGIRFNPWLFRGGFFLTGLATLMVIAAVTHQRAMMGRLLGNPVFNWVGTRSYGMYLYHWPIYQIIRGQAGVPMNLTQWLWAMAITLPVTEASYRFIETP